jgi:hypothetical protein
MPITKSEQTERLRRNEEKWTPTLMNAGWTVIPSILLEKQAALGLDAIDVNILLHLKTLVVSGKPPASIQDLHREGDGHRCEYGEKTYRKNAVGGFHSA